MFILILLLRLLLWPLLPLSLLWLALFVLICLLPLFVLRLSRLIIFIFFVRVKQPIQQLRFQWAPLWLILLPIHRVSKEVRLKEEKGGFVGGGVVWGGRRRLLWWCLQILLYLSVVGWLRNQVNNGIGQANALLGLTSPCDYCIYYSVWMRWCLNLLCLERGPRISSVKCFRENRYINFSELYFKSKQFAFDVIIILLHL